MGTANETPENNIRRQSFTLIELLVVIAIIAILAAMLMPALAQARSRGHEVVCMGNMKQFGAAVEMFLQDNDEVFPQIPYPDNFEWRRYTIVPYLGGNNVTNLQESRAFHRSGIMECPTAVSSWGRGNDETGSFSLNTYVTLRFDPYPDIRQGRRTEIATPANTGIGFDAATHYGTLFDVADWHTQMSGDNNYTQPLMPHGGTDFLLTRSDGARNYGFLTDGRSNVLMGDGRVIAMNWNDMKFGYDGQAHTDPNGSSHSGAHESGKGLGDRNDRTFESLEFWAGQ